MNCSLFSRPATVRRRSWRLRRSSRSRSARCLRSRALSPSSSQTAATPGSRRPSRLRHLLPASRLPPDSRALPQAFDEECNLLPVGDARRADSLRRCVADVVLLLEALQRRCGWSAQKLHLFGYGDGACAVIEVAYASSSRLGAHSSPFGPTLALVPLQPRFLRSAAVSSPAARPKASSTLRRRGSRSRGADAAGAASRSAPRRRQHERPAHADAHVHWGPRPGLRSVGGRGDGCAAARAPAGHGRHRRRGGRQARGDGWQARAGEPGADAVLGTDSERCSAWEAWRVRGGQLTLGRGSQQQVSMPGGGRRTRRRCIFRLTALHLSLCKAMMR